MKRILIVIFSSISLIGLGQIKTSGTFETGYENRRTLIYLPDPVQIQTGLLPAAEFGPYYGFLHVEAELKGFTAYTSNKTYFNKDTEIYFNPQMSEFKIGLYYNHNKITAGYEHLCGHTFEKRTYSEFYDRIYIRVKLF
jgi:hypothetical protein